MEPEKMFRKQLKLKIDKVKDIRKIIKERAKFKLPVEVRIKKIGERNGFNIFLVNGGLIRHFIDIDYTMGGHGLRYVYVPLNEIWIDNSNESEAWEAVFHEIYEFNLMKKGVPYDKAHDLTCLEELKKFSRKIILKVGHHRQITPWSCGPSALKIVLDYYQDKRSIKELIIETGCNKKGTLHSGFRRFLNKAGYKFFENQNSRLEDIENFIQQGIPVLVDYQAYHSGHFSVVIGYDEKRVLLSDPGYDKKFRWIRKPEFEKRWFEEDELGKIVKRWMLAVYKKN